MQVSEGGVISLVRFLNSIIESSSKAAREKRIEEGMNVKGIARKLKMRYRRAIIAGKIGPAREATEELALLNYTGVAPEVPGAMIGHCGQWQCVVRTPMRCARCDALLLQLT